MNALCRTMVSNQLRRTMNGLYSVPCSQFNDGLNGRVSAVKAAATLADKSADLPADEISETPIDFSSVKN